MFLVSKLRLLSPLYTYLLIVLAVFACGDAAQQADIGKSGGNTASLESISLSPKDATIATSIAKTRWSPYVSLFDNLTIKCLDLGAYITNKNTLVTVDVDRADPDVVFIEKLGFNCS